MDFALDDDQQLIVDTIRRFADRDLRGWAADADRAAAPPDRLVQVAGELGFYTDAVPADAGGQLEGAYSHTTRALRGYELGRGCPALAALLESNVEPALAVGRWGSGAAKQALFSSLAAGGMATLVHDSRGALTFDATGLTGKLGPAPALAVAAHVLVAISPPPGATAGAALLLLDATELRCEPIAPQSWRAARWATAQLVAHPVVHVLSRDAAAVADVLAWARTSLAARAAGAASAALDHAAAYAAERIQFGQPIGRFEALIRLRDDAQTGVDAARLMALHAAWAIDVGRPYAHDAASRARVLAGDVVAKATVDAVQIYGGYGFVNDYPVEKLMRDSRPFEALHGDERLGRVLERKAAI